MPGGKFRSFVNDMKKDFPTMDEFIQNQKKEAMKRNISKSPPKPKPLPKMNMRIRDDRKQENEKEKRELMA